MAVSPIASSPAFFGAAGAGIIRTATASGITRTAAASESFSAWKGSVEVQMLAKTDWPSSVALSRRQLAMNSPLPFWQRLFSRRPCAAAWAKMR